MDGDEYSQLILIPGLLEARCSFLPLQYSLQGHRVPVERWRDRLAFRSLDSSIDRLADAIAGDADANGSIGIVTHSFGDWIARAAIAKSRQHRVTAMVSLAPVMRAGFLPSPQTSERLGTFLRIGARSVDQFANCVGRALV